MVLFAQSLFFRSSVHNYREKEDFFMQVQLKKKHDFWHESGYILIGKIIIFDYFLGFA